jgi:hypothetical protein
MDLLKELEPVLQVKYRFPRGSGDPWERFKAVDATGFVVAEKELTTMFDSNMTMTSLLRKASTKGASKLAGEVQGGRQCSPKQALAELDQVKDDWREARADTWNLLQWNTGIAQWATAQAARQIPADVAEDVLNDERGFMDVPPAHQRQFINAVAKKAAGLSRVTLRGFSSQVFRQGLVDLAGANLTVLKLVDCAEFNPCAAELAAAGRGCILARIARKCTALEILEIRGVPKMTVLANVGPFQTHPLSFQSLRIIQVVNCAALERIWLSSALCQGSRLLVEGCDVLQAVRLEGFFEGGKCSGIPLIGPFEENEHVPQGALGVSRVTTWRPYAVDPMPSISRSNRLSLAVTPEGEGISLRPDFTFKVVLAGDCDSGKSTLLLQFTDKRFDPEIDGDVGESRALMHRPDQTYWKRQPAIQQ